EPVRAVVYHNNNTNLVTGAGKQVTVDAVAVTRVVPAMADPGRSLALTANGTHVLTAGAGQAVKMWNLANGDAERTFALPDAATAVTVAKNNLFVAVGGDKVVRVFNLNDGKELKAAPVPGAVRGLSFSPNNLALAVACADKSVVALSTALPNPAQLADFLKPIQTFAHAAAATDAVIAADNATVYTGGLDKAVKAWRL